MLRNAPKQSLCDIMERRPILLLLLLLLVLFFVFSFFNQHGGHWGFRFDDFGYFHIRFSVLMPKNFGLSVCCSFRFADFTRFSSWFSVFVKNANGFSEFFRFVFDLSGNWAPPLVSNNRETQMFLRAMCNKPTVKITSSWWNFAAIYGRSRILALRSISLRTMA